MFDHTLLGFFLELLQPSYEDDRVTIGLSVSHTLSTSERTFLLQLFTPQSFRELIKKSPAILAGNDISPSQVPDPAVIIQTLQEPLEGMKNGLGMSTVIGDPDTSISR